MSYRIEKAEFLTALSTPEDGKLPPLPEIAMVGRSNSGKSSLINALCERKSLARIGKRPGVTQAFNFFQIGFRESDCSSFDAYLVDLPGYGFAQVTGEQRRFWDQTVPVYLAERRELKLVLLLSDIRRGLGKEEEQVLEICSGREAVLCLTKADKLNRQELERALKEIEVKHGGRCSAVFVTSVLGSKFNRLDELRDFIGARLRVK